ncbi:MAG: hypothetical protein ABEH47_02890 [Haloferacaceae archaeon]
MSFGTIDRRTAVKTFGTVVVGAFAGCAGTAGGNELRNQLDAVREATSKYEDVKSALEDGFKISGPFIPGQGWHFVHPERVRSAAREGLDRSKPQVLTYDDELELGAVEWSVPADAVDGEPDLFADGNADATEHWHTHDAATHVMAKPDGERTDPASLSLSEWTTNDYWTEFHPPDRSIGPGDEVRLNWGTPEGKSGSGETRVVDLVTTHPSLRTLHVWVYADNPEGVFAESNPEFAQR